MHCIYRLLLVICAIGVTACVAVPYQDQDIQYEQLEQGVYFLKVSAPRGQSRMDLTQVWRENAAKLCSGEFRDDARIFHRQEAQGRKRVVDYQQMRGNVFCQ